MDESKKIPHLIVQLDASSLSKSGCFKRLYNTVIKGYRSPRLNNSMEFGSAFHKFTESLDVTHDQFVSIFEAQNYYQDKLPHIQTDAKSDWLNLGYLTQTCLRYVDTYGADGKKDFNFELVHEPDSGLPLVEQTFAIPFYRARTTYVENLEIMVCGTIDRIGKVTPNGAYVVEDFKTSATWDRVKYFIPYKMSTQLTLYYWALRKIAEQFSGGIIAEICKSRVLTRIHAVFLGKDKDASFQRSEARPVDERTLAEFDFMITQFCKDIASYFDHYPLDGPPPARQGLLNGSCQEPYGMCPYFGACSSLDMIAYDSIMENTFKKEPYEPLRFRE